MINQARIIELLAQLLIPERQMLFALTSQYLSVDTVQSVPLTKQALLAAGIPSHMLDNIIVRAFPEFADKESRLQIMSEQGFSKVYWISDYTFDADAMILVSVTLTACFKPHIQFINDFLASYLTSMPIIQNGYYMAQLWLLAHQKVNYIEVGRLRDLFGVSRSPVYHKMSNFKNRLLLPAIASLRLMLGESVQIIEVTKGREIVAFEISL